MSGTRPHLTSSTDNRASGVANRMSAPSAIWSPPPRQWPWIAAITGTGSLEPAVRGALEPVRDRPAQRRHQVVDPGPVAITPATSRPEQKLGPSPCRTTARTPGSRATRSAAARDRLEHRDVERVVLFRTGQRDDGDVIGDLDRDALLRGDAAAGAIFGHALRTLPRRRRRDLVAHPDRSRFDDAAPDRRTGSGSVRVDRPAVVAEYVERGQIDDARVGIPAGDQAAADVAAERQNRRADPHPRAGPTQPSSACASTPSISISIRNRRTSTASTPPASASRASEAREISDTDAARAPVDPATPAARPRPAAAAVRPPR